MIIIDEHELKNILEKIFKDFGEVPRGMFPLVIDFIIKRLKEYSDDNK